MTRFWIQIVRVGLIICLVALIIQSSCGHSTSASKISTAKKTATGTTNVFTLIHKFVEAYEEDKKQSGHGYDFMHDGHGTLAVLSSLFNYTMSYLFNPVHRSFFDEEFTLTPEYKQSSPVPRSAHVSQEDANNGIESEPRSEAEELIEHDLASYSEVPRTSSPGDLNAGECNFGGEVTFRDNYTRTYELCYCPYGYTGRNCETKAQVKCAWQMQQPLNYCPPSSLPVINSPPTDQQVILWPENPLWKKYGFDPKRPGYPPCVELMKGSNTIASTLSCAFSAGPQVEDFGDMSLVDWIISLGYVVDNSTIPKFTYDILIPDPTNSSQALLAYRAAPTIFVKVQLFNLIHLTDASNTQIAPFDLQAALTPPYNPVSITVDPQKLGQNFKRGGRVLYSAKLFNTTENALSITPYELYMEDSTFVWSTAPSDFRIATWQILVIVAVLLIIVIIALRACWKRYQIRVSQQLMAYRAERVYYTDISE